jgi:hypothetical protein
MSNMQILGAQFAKENKIQNPVTSVCGVEQIVCTPLCYMEHAGGPTDVSVVLIAKEQRSFVTHFHTVLNTMRGLGWRSG